MGFRPGDLGGYACGPPYPIHHSRKLALKKKAQKSVEKCGGAPL
jgi:hypothetical protein